MHKSLITLLLICPFASAQTCYTDINETTPTLRFDLSAVTTVTDSQTQLIWMRCAVGQSWDETSASCSGDATKFNWQEALQYSHGLTFAGQSGWRLPNVKELTSLVERQCVRPSLNPEIFPGSPSDDYWTNTPSLQDLQRAWVVAFYNGSNAVKQKTLATYLRLVREVD